MPVKRSQFEKGLGEVEYAIIRYLYENSDSAYNIEELARAVGLEKESGGLWFVLVLYGLRDKGYILVKDLDRREYFAINPSIARGLEEKRIGH